MSISFVKKTLTVILVFLTSIGYTKENPSKLKNPFMWNIYYSDGYFIERQNEIRNISNFLESNKNETTYLAITGMSGTGKTVLAREYAKKFKSNYDIVWWFNSSEDLKNQFLRFATEWNRKQNETTKKINITDINYSSAIDAVKDFLRTSDLDWLFIFDNVRSIKDIENIIPVSQSNKRAHILITSQNSVGWHKNLALSNFNRKESVELINKIVKINDSNESEKLARILGDYPILVSHISYFINLFASVNLVNKRNKEKIKE